MSPGLNSSIFQWSIFSLSQAENQSKLLKQYNKTREIEDRGKQMKLESERCNQTIIIETNFRGNMRFSRRYFLWFFGFADLSVSEAC